MKKIIVIIAIMFFYSSVVRTQINEGFESGIFPPAGWSVSHTAGTTDWSLGSSNVRSGSYNTYSKSPASGAQKNIILNLDVGSNPSKLSYWVSVSSLSTGTNAKLKIYAGANLSSLVLLRTIDLENSSVFTAANTYFNFQDDIANGTNQSGNTIDLRNQTNCYIQWSHSKVTGSAASCRMDDITLSDATPLPVELTSFTANVSEKTVQLNWQTATEVDNYGFDVERYVEKEKSGWRKIGFVQGHGNSNSPKDYSFTDGDIQFTGLYKYRLKQVDTDGSFEYSPLVEAQIGTPEKYELAQNYPNPFNPSTVIKYSLPTDGFVQLKVYDILGNEVAALVNENISAGTHEATFDASGFASGIYFYTIQTGSFRATKKMMLLK